MELWDLYDEFRNPLHQVHTRGEKLAEGVFHLGVGIITINDNKQILLTKRSSDKKDFPDCWEFSGGAVLAGETTEVAAVRELQEETGIEITTNDLILIDSNKGNATFIDTYIVKRNVVIEELKLQVGETNDAKWVSFDEMMQIINENLFPSYLAKKVLNLKEKIEDNLLSE